MVASNSFETITWWFFNYYNQINILLDAGDWRTVREHRLLGSLETELGKITRDHGVEYVSNLRGMYRAIEERFATIRLSNP